MILETAVPPSVSSEKLNQFETLDLGFKVLLGESYVMPTFFQLDDLVGTVSSHYLNGLDVP